MKRGGSLVVGVPIITKYMQDNDVGLTVVGTAKILDTSKTNAYTILTYMEGAGIVKRVRRGESYYILMENIEKGRVEEVLDRSGAPKVKVSAPRRRRIAKPKVRARKKVKILRVKSDEYISEVSMQAASSEIPSALGILGLQQAKQILVRPEPTYVRKVDTGIIRLDAFGSVEYISNGIRLLSRNETIYLRSYLVGFEGYEKLLGYECFWVEESILARGEYGNIFYISIGTNSFDYVKRVTLDESIFRYQPLFSNEKRRWENWADFDSLLWLGERRTSFSRDQYMKILDLFIDRGEPLVEIEVEKRSSTYMVFRMRKIIKERGLEDHIKVSKVNKYLYLEKVI